jgi:YggT family protein
MLIFGNFLVGLATVLQIVLTVYMWIIIAQAVLSWVNPDPYNPIVRIIRQVTDPVLFQIRRRIPTVFGGIDFSPVIVLLGIIFLQEFLVKSLFQLGRMM